MLWIYCGHHCGIQNNYEGHCDCHDCHDNQLSTDDANTNTDNNLFTVQHGNPDEQIDKPIPFRPFPGRYPAGTDSIDEPIGYLPSFAANFARATGNAIGSPGTINDYGYNH